MKQFSDLDAQKRSDLKKVKATWWIVTAYGENADRLQLASHPQWCYKVHGGMEECPSTKRPHFQGALQCVRQVRGSQVLAYLPNCHIEPARSKEAVLTYVMKSETAIGPKTSRENPLALPYVSMPDALLMIAKYWVQFNVDEHGVPGHNSYLSYKMDGETQHTNEDAFWFAARSYVSKNYNYIAVFQAPQYPKLWDKFNVELLQKAVSEYVAPPSITEEPASESEEFSEDDVESDGSETEEF